MKLSLSLILGILILALALAGSFYARYRGEKSPSDIQATSLSSGELCSPFNPLGTGLKGEYFSKENFKGPLLLSRIDSAINFESNTIWPSSTQGQTVKSVRWSGWLKPPLSGVYQFHCDSPGAQMILSNQNLIDSGDKSSRKMELTTGRLYSLTIEIPNFKDPSSSLRFEWTTPYGVRYPVPRSLLFPPVETAR